jgi:hypothetical protein
MFLVFRAVGAVGESGDSHVYLQMAAEPSATAPAPWGLRILAPWLVAASGLSPRNGFTLLTLGSLAATATLLYFRLRLVVERGTAAFGMFLFVSSFGTIGLLRNPYLVDALAFPFIMAAFLLYSLRRWAALAVVMAIGMLAKESMIFVVVTVVADWGLELIRNLCLGTSSGSRNASSNVDRPARVIGGGSVALVVALPLAVFFALHYGGSRFPQASARSFSYLSGENWSAVVAYQQKWGGPAKTLVQAFMYSWGVLWLALPLCLLRVRGDLRRQALFLVPVLASMLIATDWIRMLSWAFPVIVPLVCAGGFRSKWSRFVLLPYAGLPLMFWIEPSTMKNLANGALLLGGGALTLWGLAGARVSDARCQVE